MKKLMICLFALALSFAVGCGPQSDDDGSGSANADQPTKDEVRGLGGKQDGVDLCDFLGWYGDDICDDWCPEPDPDCSPDDDDPDVPDDPDDSDDSCGGFAGFTCESDEYCDYPDDAVCGVADQFGTCEPRPDACNLIWDPVCGCDGNTYGNACDANLNGVDVAHEGECGSPTPGCSADSDCAAGEVCVAGSCEPAPECQTNAECNAGEACIDGKCETVSTSGDCGGFAGLTCADDEYCDYPDDSICGAADQLGTCEPRPDGCNLIADPVCGCDGNTYSNACDANVHGVDVAHDGACDSQCAADADCAAGEICVDGICEPDTTQACAADSDCATGEVCVNGICEPGSMQCAADSDCAAGETCVNGVCEPASDDCGGFAGLTCAANEWCDHPDGSFCGGAHQIGTCEPKPDVCTAVIDPVCGCDGNTYNNACEAHAFGVDVASQGQCN